MSAALVLFEAQQYSCVLWVGNIGYVEFENYTELVTSETTDPNNPLDYIFPGQWLEYRVFREGGSSGPVVAEVNYEVTEVRHFFVFLTKHA